jgi:hypothetical protein
MKIVLACWPAVLYQSVVLTYEKYDNRLVSYAFLKELPEEFLTQYVELGYGPTRKKDQ